MSRSSAPDQPPGKPNVRRMRGFEAASALVGDRIRTAGEKRGFAVARLLTHWAEIAGPELAEVTRPVRVGYTRDGLGATLTILTTSSHAPIVQMQLPRLRDRVNACYGYSAISRISITQTAPGGFAEGAAIFAHAPAPAPEPEDPAVAGIAGSMARDVRDDDLRRALEAFSRNYLNRSKKKEGTK